MYSNTNWWNYFFRLDSLRSFRFLYFVSATFLMVTFFSVFLLECIYVIYTTHWTLKPVLHTCIRLLGTNLFIFSVGSRKLSVLLSLPKLINNETNNWVPTEYFFLFLSRHSAASFLESSSIFCGITFSHTDETIWSSNVQARNSVRILESLGEGFFVVLQRQVRKYGLSNECFHERSYEKNNDSIEPLRHYQMWLFETVVIHHLSTVFLLAMSQERQGAKATTDEDTPCLQQS